MVRSRPTSPQHEDKRAYKVSEGCVRPEHTLGGYTFSRLSELHADDGAEEIFDFFAICIVGYPTWSADGDAPHDKGGKMNEGNTIEVCGEQASDVLLESDKKDACDGSLELGYGCHHRVRDTAFDVRSEFLLSLTFLAVIVSVARITGAAVCSFLLWPQGRPLLHVRVFRWHCGVCEPQSTKRYIRDYRVDGGYVCGPNESSSSARFVSCVCNANSTTQG